MTTGFVAIAFAIAIAAIIQQRTSLFGHFDGLSNARMQ